MTSFQDIVPLGTARYKHKSYDQCYEILDQEASRLEREEGPLGCAYNPCFIIDIEEKSFRECSVHSDEKLLTLSWETYDHVAQSALFKMESGAHAVAAGTFRIIFSAWASGVENSLLLTTGRSIVRRQNRSKRPDMSWTLSGVPTDGWSKRWPVCVAEVGWSGHRAKLEDDVNFWLNNPDSYTSVVLSISVLCDKIMVERWEGRGGSPSPVQMIQILRDPRPGCPHVNGELEIKSADIFSRDKMNEGEKDFVLTASDMELLARTIWTLQFPKDKKDQLP